jgi:membrane protease YdiL (CAAX protease family)
MGDVLTLAIVLLVAGFLLSSGISLALAGGANVVTGAHLLAGWGASLVVVGGYVWATRRRTPEERQALRLERGLLPLPYAVLFGVAVAFTLDLLAFAVGAGFGRVAELRALTAGNPAEILLAVVVLVVLQPAVLGVAFCGVILPRLRASLGSWAGIWATVGAFTAYHFALFGAQLPSAQQFGYGVLVPFCLMLSLCALRIRTASTLAAVLAYSAWGVVAVVVMLALG